MIHNFLLIYTSSQDITPKLLSSSASMYKFIKSFQMSHSCLLLSNSELCLAFPIQKSTAVPRNTACLHNIYFPLLWWCFNYRITHKYTLGREGQAVHSQDHILHSRAMSVVPDTVLPHSRNASHSLFEF